MVKTCYRCGYEGDDFSPKVSCCRSCKRERNKIDNARHIKANRGAAYSSKYRVPNTIVYGFEGANGIAYIGSTDNGAFRLWEHYNDKVKSFCKELSPLKRQISFKYHVLWHGESLEDAKHQEKALIQLHQPEFNKILYKHYEG